MEQTIVYLTQEDAKLFVEFQKRYLFMKLLESLEVFTLDTGKVTISFTNKEIHSVDVNKHYRLP